VRETHGFDSLSILISETKAGSGAPRHRHKCEEAHDLLKGKAQYVIGDKTFIAEAPYVVRIPAGVDHSFKNVGTEPINVIGIFPKNQESELIVKKNDSDGPSVITSFSMPCFKLAAPGGTTVQARF
jgi:mannose-6-phosphate isomerase-like protein (cupin superfamily)